MSATFPEDISDALTNNEFLEEQPKSMIVTVALAIASPIGEKQYESERQKVVYHRFFFNGSFHFYANDNECPRSPVRLPTCWF
jgi:hypothetical protein